MSSANANYVIAHGALMCAVWALLIPFGILFARHRWLVEVNGLKWAAKPRLAIVIIAMVSGVLDGGAMVLQCCTAASRCR